MEYSYSNRNCLLPKGCKDLIDAIHLPPEISADISRKEDGLIFRFKVSDLRRVDADIRFEQNCLRVVLRTADGQVPREKLFAVPSGYNLAKALTTYTEDEVRIFVPRC
ncbi:MAG TPA: hypothetical protein VGJ73_09160 [Verrucomicrobiae bacterium]|jgi:hypothetical protein